MASFAIVKSWPGNLARTGVATEAQLDLFFWTHDTTTGAQTQGDFSVVLTSSDTAATIQTKIRDAAIAAISAQYGITVATNNLFQYSIVRG